MSTTVGAGMPDWRIPVAVGPEGRPPAQGWGHEAAVPASRPCAAALGAVEHHERVRDRSVWNAALHVRHADHLVSPIPVEVGHARGRRRPLEPRRPADVWPWAGVAVVVASLHPRVQPADELSPAEARPLVSALAVGVPPGCQDRAAVVVEDVDLVVVERDDDLELRIVVEVSDSHVLPIRAVTVVPDPVEGRSVALYRGHAVGGAPLGRYTPPDASNTNTCEPLVEVFVVVTTTSMLPSPSRSAAAMPRASGHCPPLQVEAGHPGFTRSRPPARLYAATVPSLPPTTISGTASPSRSATTPGA